jgi:hypothetical protein
MFNLGEIYDDGVGVKRDYGQAVAWYRKAVAKGNRDGECNLADKYEFARGVKRNYPEARRLYFRSLQRGNSAAAYGLGLMSLEGRGTPKSQFEAVKWISLAIAEGEPRAGKDLERAKRGLSRAEIARAVAAGKAWRKAHPVP